MAQLRNLDRIFSLAPGASVTIGHNRTVTRVDAEGEPPRYACALHGHTVATMIPTARDAKACRVVLDSCGYRTRTTQSAMKDFCKAFGLSVGVSFAQGQFWVRFKQIHGAWVERVQTDSNGGADRDAIEFLAGRYA